MNRALASLMAMVGGVAIANIQPVDLHNSRNIAILGFSLMVGLCVPNFIEKHPNLSVGWPELDQIIHVLMSMPMFCGAFTACILDNTVPGATRTQRGLTERGHIHDLGPDNRDIYELPSFLMRLIERFPAIRVLPIIPKTKKINRIYTDDSIAQPKSDISS